MRSRRGVWAAAVALACVGAPAVADAFCGFYVSGADASLYNNATLVVLMRDGTRTVLSMQNNYEGPPQSFAMVVPVPVVLQKENVKTLPREVFQRVDQLAAPRLVEYWEQNPCPPPVKYDRAMPVPSSAPGGVPKTLMRGDALGVTVEAKFTVGEYNIVILGAQDALGLDTWLRREGYKIPAGAEPYLRPYVRAGMKFFVAKVDVTKVSFDKGGQAMLSPLRFHYDTETFSLPVRLGLMNSSGTQDLLVHILARGQRYEVANFDNVSIPTNLDVSVEAKGRFGEVYAALFDRTLEKSPGAVVTEYAWDSMSCDPCPTPPLTGSDLATLGADVTAQAGDMGRGGSGFVLTRLHARYKKDSLGQDLVFRAAPPIAGGREFGGGQDGALEQGAKPDSVNNFQARYAVRHPWTGPIKCKDPIRGVWGGPPPGVTASTGPKVALDLAFAPRGKAELGAFLPKIGVDAALKTAIVLSKGIVEPAGDAQGGGAQGDTGAGETKPTGEPSGAAPPAMPPEGGCAGCRTASSSGGLSAALGAAAAAVLAAALAGRRSWRGRKGTRSTKG
jgi:hypothetical protein